LCPAPLALTRAVAQAQAVVAGVAERAAVLASGEQAGGGLEAAVAQQQLRRAGRGRVQAGHPPLARPVRPALAGDVHGDGSRAGQGADAQPPGGGLRVEPPTWTASSRPTTVTVTGTPATVTVFFSFTVILRPGLGCRPAARGPAGQRERVGAVLVGADLVQAVADEGPAGACDGERDFADDHDVPLRQFPGRFSRVADQTAPRWTSMHVVVSCHCHPFWMGWGDM